MDRAIISAKDEKAQSLVKEAKKKAIDLGLTFSDAMLLLIGKWLSGDVSIEDKKEVRK
jgi:hypothetical protein